MIYKNSFTTSNVVRFTFKFENRNMHTHKIERTYLRVSCSEDCFKFRNYSIDFFFRVGLAFTKQKHDTLKDIWQVKVVIILSVFLQ